MAKNKTKVASWALSLIVHATGLVMILVAGFHLAAPDGAVTDKVEFDAVDNKPAPVENTPSQPVQAAQPAVEHQEAASQPEAQAPVDEAPPPEAQANTDTQPDEEAPPAPQEEMSQNDPTADTAAMPSESPEETETPAVAPTSTPEATPSERPSVPGTGTAESNFQNAGATIDESKLTEAFGNHKPSYPYMSRLRRQQGTVILRAYVNADGSVNQVTIATSSGFSAIDEEARTTYGRWKYQPGLTGWVVKPFKFSLK